MPKESVPIEEGKYYAMIAPGNIHITKSAVEAAKLIPYGWQAVAEVPAPAPPKRKPGRPPKPKPEAEAPPNPEG